ncbi:hypothetical protein T439DRAFT_295159, partial [Meredithblackwellia eburnea MCA 4105]
MVSSEQDPNSIIIEAKIGGKIIPTMCLVDTGATHSYIDHDLAHRTSLPLVELPQPITISNFDGSPSSNGRVTHSTKINLSIGSR